MPKLKRPIASPDKKTAPEPAVAAAAFAAFSAGAGAGAGAAAEPRRALAAKPGSATNAVCGRPGCPALAPGPALALDGAAGNAGPRSHDAENGPGNAAPPALLVGPPAAANRLLTTSPTANVKSGRATRTRRARTAKGPFLNPAVLASVAAPTPAHLPPSDLAGSLLPQQASRDRFLPPWDDPSGSATKAEDDPLAAGQDYAFSRRAALRSSYPPASSPDCPGIAVRKNLPEGALVTGSGVPPPNRDYPPLQSKRQHAQPQLSATPVPFFSSAYAPSPLTMIQQRSELPPTMSGRAACPHPSNTGRHPASTTVVGAGPSQAANAVSLAVTIIRSFPVWDVIAILILLLQLPSAVLSLVQFLFTALTFVPPVAGAVLSALPSFDDLFQSAAAGSPSLGTIIAADTLVFLMWLLFGVPAQNLFLDLSQAVIAVTLGGAAASGQSTSNSVMLSTFVIAASHLFRLKSARNSWLNLALSFFGKADFADRATVVDMLPESLTRPRGWVESLLGVHIVTQAIVRIIRRFIYRFAVLESAAALAAAGSAASASGPTGADSAKANNTGSAADHPGSGQARGATGNGKPPALARSDSNSTSNAGSGSSDGADPSRPIDDLASGRHRLLPLSLLQSIFQHKTFTTMVCMANSILFPFKAVDDLSSVGTWSRRGSNATNLGGETSQDSSCTTDEKTSPNPKSRPSESKSLALPTDAPSGVSILPQVAGVEQGGPDSPLVLAKAPTAKMKRRQANWVRSIQPLWSALANAKVHVFKRSIENSLLEADSSEHQNVVAPEDESDKTDSEAEDGAVSSGIAMLSHEWFGDSGEEDVIWITDVKPTSVEFIAYVLSGHAHEDEPAQQHPPEGWLVKPFGVRINGADWSTVNLQWRAETVDNLKRQIQVWHGLIRGLSSSSSYMCDFFRISDNMIVASTNLVTPLSCTGESAITAPATQSLRPLSPVATLRNSIAAVEQKLSDTRSFVKRNRKDNSKALSALRREVDTLQSRLAHEYADDRNFSRLNQLRQSARMAEEATTAILAQIELVTKDCEAERELAKQAKDVYASAAKKLKDSKEKLKAQRQDSTKRLKEVNAILVTTNQKRERLKQRSVKLGDQLEKLEREEKENSARHANRLRAFEMSEQRLLTKIEETEQQCGELEDRLGSLYANMASVNSGARMMGAPPPSQNSSSQTTSPSLGLADTQPSVPPYSISQFPNGNMNGTFGVGANGLVNDKVQAQMLSSLVDSSSPIGDVPYEFPGPIGPASATIGAVLGQQSHPNPIGYPAHTRTPSAFGVSGTHPTFHRSYFSRTATSNSDGSSFGAVGGATMSGYSPPLADRNGSAGLNGGERRFGSPFQPSGTLSHGNRPINRRPDSSFGPIGSGGGSTANVATLNSSPSSEPASGRASRAEAARS